MIVAAILGARSMLGEALERQLLAQGMRVLRVGRGPADDIALDLGMPLPDASEIDHRADVLFHCAASFANDEPAGVAANLRLNTAACAEVLELMARLHCNHVVYAGSVWSIDGADSAGRNAYGLSKALAEQVLAWGMARTRGRFCSLRLSLLYDTQGRCCSRQPWFGRIVGHASRGLDLSMPAGGGLRDFVHVDDAARVMIAAAKRGLAGTWPVCSGEALAPASIAALAYSQFGRGGKIRIDPSKAPFREMTFPDGRPVFRELAQPPCRSLQEGLAGIIRAGTGERFGPVEAS